MLIRRAIPQSDFVFSSEDFNAGELVTHAQSCTWLLGWSDLGSALLTKVDPHSALAATVLGVTPEEFAKHKKERKFKDARQASKPFNFGRPAGMGAAKIVGTQRKQGPDTPCPNGPSMIEDGGKLVPGYKGLRFCILMDGAERCGVQKTTVWGKREQRIAPTCVRCLECADRLNQFWLKQWSENQPYFDLISSIVEEGQTIHPEALERWPWLKDFFQPWQQLAPGEIMQHVTGRIRRASGAESPFCTLANGFFQAFLADIAKEAHRYCTMECYDRTFRVPEFLFENSLKSEFAGGESPLYGSRIPAFAHDELIGEHPRSVGHEAATRISEVMRDVMRWRCPDLAPAAKAEPTLMNEWSKGAEKVVHRGRLVPWFQGHNEKTCSECQAA
jgi:hypothetical protein